MSSPYGNDQIRLDDSGRAELLSPEQLRAPEINVVVDDIAPWLIPDDEPPTPPPKPNRSFGFQTKASFSSFSIPRQPSVTNFMPSRNGSRPSESHSITESSSSTHSLRSSNTETSQQSLGHDLPRSKSSLFAKLIRPSRSKSRLRSGSSETPSHSPPPPLPDIKVPFLPLSGPPSPVSSSHHKRSKKKKSSTGRGAPLPPKQPEFTLDTNLDQMDGIVDLTILPNLNPDTSSPGSGFEGYQSSSDHGLNYFMSSSPPTSNSMFINPFQPPSSAVANRHAYEHHRKVSPNSQVPPLPIQLDARPPDGFEEGSWTAPESWVVEKGDDELEEPQYSSSEAEDVPAALQQRALDTSASTKQRRRRTIMKPPRPTEYKIRVYRANNSFYIIHIGVNVTVGELSPKLNEKLLNDSERETHRLYLKERGRERVLAQTEKPADIVRRRLEQAGYDIADGLELLRDEDMTFVLKFVYKTQLLGPAEEEMPFDNYTSIDLTGRSLRTVPIVLHAHAEAIHSLTLSRNPMLDIPLDFVQSCTNLNKLYLTNMAIKKVPNNVRYSSSLKHLYISCNRIVDLDDAGLDRIPELETLEVQNNRMEKLPWYFPRLRHLQRLNISNNKFKTVPAVVCVMASLVELDISFNMISELPEEIGQLRALKKLILVGNQVSRFPDECSNLVSLRVLDCRRNHITDVANVCKLPKLHTLCADHNAIHALDLTLGPCLTSVDASHNDITRLSLLIGPAGQGSHTLTVLNISHAKLSSLDHLVFSQLKSIQTLILNHNTLRVIPESLGELTRLTLLNCADNQLTELPASIGQLQKLETLDAHNNSLSELPVSLWNCASLTTINVTSNLLGTWHDPPVVSGASSAMLAALDTMPTISPHSVNGHGPPSDRKASTSSLARQLPPLVYSLEKLYIGENRLTDDVLHPLAILRELKVLNLSFNFIQELPPTFFRHLTQLEELYLSGNKLTSIPTEHLPQLTRLAVMFLNGNKLQTLPQELGKVQGLMILDVGSNLLKYNINNWEFDWNWNFNKNLRYLNLSGNKRLQIKSEASNLPKMQQHKHNPSSHFVSRQSTEVGIHSSRKYLSGFTDLNQLCVLGLMDVTMTATGNTNIDIPDENETRRVRTSLSTVNNMSYGIADNIGRHDHLTMLDLVYEFTDSSRRGEAVFAMFGRANPTADAGNNNRLAKYLNDHFMTVFKAQLSMLSPSRSEVRIPDALRRSFLKLNKDMHDMIFAISNNRKMSQASASTAGTGSHVLAPNSRTDARGGASGIVVYFVGKTMYVANAGNALAVVSRQGTASAISRKHDPFDRSETARIRAAEGWVSPAGFVNGEIDISRSFGFFHLLPMVNARPDIVTWELSELDEFVIIGNRGLWDFVSYQTAVDIARSERDDPMIAAQKLRDFAISYGAQGSTMIMVIGVADLFNNPGHVKRESIADPSGYGSLTKRKRQADIVGDRTIMRLDGEVEAPVGHITLVFSDIRNSTHLWEANPGMPTAMRLHNNLMRRLLRLCGGYEVKTEGDAFMCSFPTTLAAVWWCLTVQTQLLHEPWPLEILECADGKEIRNENGVLIARGISVRMGIHCGAPICETDPITKRMDYFGPIVNRSARVCSKAAGGQIMCSADVIREIAAKFLDGEPETEFSEIQPLAAVEGIRNIGVSIVPIGEFKLKGLEVLELISAIYPSELVARQYLKEEVEANPNVEQSRVQFSVVQMRELGVLCLRLEALSASRVFRTQESDTRKNSVDKLLPVLDDLDEEPTSPTAENACSDPVYIYGDPDVLLPAMNDKASDADLMCLLDSLSIRIDNALAKLRWNDVLKKVDVGGAINALQVSEGLDERTLAQLLSILQGS